MDEKRKGEIAMVAYKRYLSEEDESFVPESEANAIASGSGGAVTKKEALEFVENVINEVENEMANRFREELVYASMQSHFFGL